MKDWDANTTRNIYTFTSSLRLARVNNHELDVGVCARTRACVMAVSAAGNENATCCIKNPCNGC